MACLQNYTLKGIGLDCNPVLAGIKNLYLGYFDDFKVTYSAETMTATIANAEDSTGKLYPYQITVNTGGLTSTLTKNDQNGTRYYTNVISAQFTRLETIKHLEVQAMAAEALIAIVEDNNGECWLVGADSYATGVSATAQTGSSFDDLNGYNVELQARSAYMPFKVTGFESLIDKSNIQ